MLGNKYPFRIGLNWQQLNDKQTHHAYEKRMRVSIQIDGLALHRRRRTAVNDEELKRKIIQSMDCTKSFRESVAVKRIEHISLRLMQ